MSDNFTSDAVPENLRRDGLHSLSAMVLGAADMGRKVLSPHIVRDSTDDLMSSAVGLDH